MMGVIVGVRVIRFEKGYGSGEQPLPPSGGRNGDRRAYLKAWRAKNPGKGREYHANRKLKGL